MQGVDQVLVILVCVLVSYAIYWFLARRRRQPLLVQSAAVALCTIVFILVLTAYSIFIGQFIPGRTTLSWPALVQQVAIAGWAPFALYSASVLALIKSFEARLNDLRNASLEREIWREQLRTLRMQLNPHFISNALGGVSTLIGARRYEDANEIAERLARFLRDTRNSRTGMTARSQTSLS